MISTFSVAEAVFQQLANLWKYLGSANGAELDGTTSLGDQLNAVLATVQDIQMRLATVDSLREALDQEVATRAAQVAELQQQVGGGTGDYTALEKRVSANEAAVTAVSAQVAGLNTQVADLPALKTQVAGLASTSAAHETALAGLAPLQAEVEAHATALTTHEGAITQNASGLADLAERVNELAKPPEGDGGTVSAEQFNNLALRVTQNETAVAANATAVTAVDARVATLEKGIADQGWDDQIATLQTHATALATQVSAQATDIANAQGVINDLQADFAQLTALGPIVNTLQAGVDSNAAAVAALQKDGADVQGAVTVLQQQVAGITGGSGLTDAQISALVPKLDAYFPRKNNAWFRTASVIISALQQAGQVIQNVGGSAGQIELDWNQSSTFGDIISVTPYAWQGFTNDVGNYFTVYKPLRANSSTVRMGMFWTTNNTWTSNVRSLSIYSFKNSQYTPWGTGRVGTLPATLT